MKDLPAEMLILIFEKINDPLNLLLLREVCTRWADTADYLFIKLKLWTELCSEYSVQPWITKVIEKRFPLATGNKWQTLTQLDWKKVYLSYRNWQICYLFKECYRVVSNHNLLKNEAQYESITCMDVRANCLVTGSSIGIVNYLSIDETIQLLYAKEYPHYSITNIKLWYTDKKQLIAVISLENRVLEFWDVWDKRSIPSSLINHPSTAIVCDDHRLFIANGLKIFECVWNNNQIIKGKECILGRFPRNPVLQPLDITYMNINPDNTITAVRCDYRILIINTFRIPTPENSDFEPFIGGFKRYYENKQFKNQQFIFNYPITDTVLIINDEHLHMCHNILGNYRWKTFVLQLPLASNISAFFTHANVLLFGFDSGSVLMLVVKDFRHLPQLDAASVFGRNFKIDNQPITNLNVAEYNYMLHIFVTVGNKVYIITFPTEEW